jgi:UDP-N-acetylglucosamine 2-epimerase
MLQLEESADCILTDSGGMQKEAYWLGVRCITLRDETEWVETVAEGWNILAGMDHAKIVDAVEHWRPGKERQPIYGDGHAAEKIANILIIGEPALRERN